MAEVYCDFRLDANTDKEFEIIKEILEHKILNQKYVFIVLTNMTQRIEA